MTYRVSKKRRDQLAQMRIAKARKREAGLAPEYPVVLPELRRRLIVQDFDCGENTHVLEFYATRRIDCYRVTVDGKEWKKSIGWSRALAGLRKSLPRVASL